MKRQRGFTLLELMITVSVAAILLALGVPGMQDFIRNNRRAAEVNNLVTALHTARSESVSRNQRVGICPSTDGINCAASTTWETGWIVYVDADGDGTRDTADEDLLRVDAPVDGMTVRASFQRLAYRPNGRMETFPDLAEQGEIVFCDGRGAAQARVVQIEVTGRPGTSSKRLDGSDPTCPS